MDVHAIGSLKIPPWQCVLIKNHGIMKTLKTSLKTIALFFLVLTLLQSCVAYQKTPVSLLQAEQSKKRVKLKNSADQTY